jgi:phospholipase C
MPIQHFFVLMLENRSFDHIFGFSPFSGPLNNTNTDTATGKTYPVQPTADFSLKGLDVDPGHEFGDVQQQLAGGNGGFVNNYAAQKGVVDPGRVMNCFSPAQLPVLNQLAAEFAVCDSWFSSLPGPTWPNRFFMMAASSGGLTKSPSTGDIIKATALQGYSFQHGNIFDALDKNDIPWCIVEGDVFPISFALKGMDENSAKGRFVSMDNFAARLADPTFSERFIFIEPQYGTHKFDVTGPGDFSGGNSMHPLDDVRKGEQLVKQVYETIRNVPAVWANSVLLITFDEHGGFYDHVQPPATTPPADNPINAAPGQQPFDFNQLGVRVPAIIVSPLIEKGVIDHSVYDHTSALATLERLLNVPPLTERDAAAKDFSHLFTLATPRTDTPAVLTNPAIAPAEAVTALTAAPEDTQESLTAELALLESPLTPSEPAALDLEQPSHEAAASSIGRASRVLSPAPEVSGPQVGFAYVGLLRALSHAKDPVERESWKKEFSAIRTRRDAARFMTRAQLKVRYNVYSPPNTIP